MTNPCCTLAVTEFLLKEREKRHPVSFAIQTVLSGGVATPESGASAVRNSSSFLNPKPPIHRTLYTRYSPAETKVAFGSESGTLGPFTSSKVFGTSVAG